MRAPRVEFGPACPQGQSPRRAPRSPRQARSPGLQSRGARSRTQSRLWATPTPKPAFPFNARSRQGPRVPSPHVASSASVSLSSPGSAGPSPWDGPRPRPRPPPPSPARRSLAGLSCHFTFPRRLPHPWPGRPGGPPPARAPSCPRPLAATRREGAGRSGLGAQGGARRRTADVGLALSRSLAGGRAGTRTGGRARGRPGGGGGGGGGVSRRRWLHFPGLRGGHSGSRGQQPWEPELERPRAAAAALRDLTCPLRHKELMTVQALVEEVLMETNVKVFSKNQKENKFSPRKRKEKYPAKQLLNCQRVLKEFRRNLQRLHWTLLPTVVLDPKETTFMNGGQLYWDPQDLSMKEGCSFLTLPFHQTIRLNPLRMH